MIPGSTIIKKCSECSGLIREYSIESGNTYGAKYWTDGKRLAPMLPDQPWLVKCPHCQNLLWIDKLEKIREIEPMYDYKDSKDYNEPELQDYLAKLNSNNLSSEEILYIRMCAWWVGNDVRRIREDELIEKVKEYWKNLPDESSEKEKLRSFVERNSIPKEILILSDKERNNLEMLYDIFNSSDYELLMKAEIKRELGQFEDAADILKHRFEEYPEHYSVIKKLVEKRDPFVAEIKYEN